MVNLASGTNTLLNGTLPTGGNVDEQFQIHPSGTSVIYIADQDLLNKHELYRVNVPSLTH